MCLKAMQWITVTDYEQKVSQLSENQFKIARNEQNCVT